MATSQNGWQVYTSGAHPDLIAIPKVVGRVRRGDVATIFTYLVDRFDREVEDVDVGRDEWGYAYRAIRGKTSGYSNHASATALDLNAMQHPLGRVNTYTPSQRAALRRILNDLEGVVRWGGDYSGRKDEMHFEINASAAAVARVAGEIRAGSLVSRPITGGGSVTIPNVPGGTPAPPQEADDMTPAESKMLADIHAKLGTVFNTLTPGEAGVKHEGDVYGRVRRTEADAAQARAWGGTVYNTLTPGTPGVKNEGTVFGMLRRVAPDTAALIEQAQPSDPKEIANLVVAALGPDLAAQVAQELTITTKKG